MAAILKVSRNKSKFRLRSVHRFIYTKNKNPVKFHPDPIWNDVALGLFEDGHLSKKKKKKKKKKNNNNNNNNNKILSSDAIYSWSRIRTELEVEVMLHPSWLRT